MKAEHGLHWHPKGGWSRKFPGDRNRTYFGKVAPSDAARALFLEESKRTGLIEREKKLANLSAREGANLFLGHLDLEFERGEIQSAQRANYAKELAHFFETFTKTRAMAELSRRDAPLKVFRPARAAAVKRGVFAAEKHITMIRTWLRWCSSVQRYTDEPFYADEFRQPSMKEKRTWTKGQRREHGTAAWSPDEVREIVTAAKDDVHRYAQVMLMLNGGMGSTDLSNLDDAEIDWDKRCIHTDRSKTLVPRVVPLWDVTAEAMKASRAARPDPADPKYATRFFLTMHGRPLVVEELADERREKVTRTDALKNWFYQLVNGAPRKKWKTPVVRLPHLKRHRGGIYTLRSVFMGLSLGHGQDRNLEAVILGQQFDRPIIEYYLRGDLREKLVAVVEHVRQQIWGKTPGDGGVAEVTTVEPRPDNSRGA
jgi:integrase